MKGTLIKFLLGGTKENFRQNECSFTSSHNKNIVLQLCLLSFPSLQFSAKKIHVFHPRVGQPQWFL